VTNAGKVDILNMPTAIVYTTPNGRKNERVLIITLLQKLLFRISMLTSVPAKNIIPNKPRDEMKFNQPGIM